MNHNFHESTIFLPNKENNKVKYIHQYPIGTKCVLRLDNGSTFETETRSETWVLNGREVILVKGKSGCYCLDRLEFND